MIEIILGTSYPQIGGRDALAGIYQFGPDKKCISLHLPPSQPLLLDFQFLSTGDGTSSDFMINRLDVY